jgi:outer membrane lipoprotein-sorting protein
MNMVKSGLTFLFAVASITVIKAQTADEIVNKYVDAMGGKDKLEQVKTVIVNNTTQVMGNEGPSTTQIINGKAFRLDYEINGQKSTQVYTDKGGWQINPFMGAVTAQPIPEEMYKQSRGQLYFTGPLYNYAARGSKVELVGKEGDTYKLKITNTDSAETMAYIDAITYYLTKITRQTNFMGQNMELSVSFSNFKKADLGITIPYTTEISYGGQFTITNNITKIEFNKTIDPSVFEMPKS